MDGSVGVSVALPGLAEPGKPEQILLHNTIDTEAGFQCGDSTRDYSPTIGRRSKPIRIGILLCAMMLVAVSGLVMRVAPVGEKVGALEAPRHVARRILNIQHDSCWGGEGAFAVEKFENIGSVSICDGLCNMNGEKCIARAYMLGTKSCYLKVACKNQLSDTSFIPLEEND
eukprot:CAMPEP_0117657342 /NCGR_PEP_ID=MMETSP0804-20121206/5279_1 /TAXON_ID=1074897 /ORGANISM="Tetraselmis astigmatica, Strain CCMP880" /LENGTH=170 /DNA_ID=CAMNT_0005463789 /DNA_START=116 /DNA_END=628 /DNA_ORIENTATION=-